MLQQLDVAIALVVVLLGVSLCVTILVQMVSSLFNLRGTHLRAGLVTLLETVDPSLKQQAQAIVDAVLMHPLVSDSAFSRRSPFLANAIMPASLTATWQRASAIRAYELNGVLHALVADAGNAAKPWYNSLKAALATDPAGVVARAQVTLDDVKALPASDAGLQAIATNVMSRASGAEARIDAWFDTTMDRVSQRFTLNVRSWTIGVSIALALLMHFDAIDLYNKVSADQDLRARLVELSKPVGDDALKLAAPPADLASLQATAKDLRTRFTIAQFQFQLPTWTQQKQLLTGQDMQGLLGILIGAGLLSLGSPFWFNALKGLTSLKTSVASAIDKEKAAPPAAGV